MDRLAIFRFQHSSFIVICAAELAQTKINDTVSVFASV